MGGVQVCRAKHFYHVDIVAHSMKLVDVEIERLRE